jgi:hypothetical protein
MAHRLLMLGCKTMRDGVVVSSVFFAGAVLLFLAAQYVVSPSVPVLGHVVLFFALVLIVLAPVILVSTFLLSVFPGAREKLEKCEH